MRFYLRLFILTCFLVLGICVISGRLTGNRAFGEGSTEERQTGNAETTLKVLTENCGKCHQSSLPTADSKALAIFDLDKTPWYTSVTDKQLESISRRISTKSGISDSDRTATLEFLECIRQSNCKDKD